MKRYAIVPVEDLQKVEKARIELYKLFENDPNIYFKLQNITEAFWIVGNKNYRKIVK